MNPYLPIKAEIMSVVQETGTAAATDLDIKTYRLRFPSGFKMDFLPGQFVELSIPGIGEAPFGFASDPFIKDYIELTIKKTGVLTDAIHALRENDTLWIRGPFGNNFPIDKIKGRDVIFVAGGLGLAPLRPLISYVFNKRNEFGTINMLFAARTSMDFLYQYQFEEWRAQADTTVALTIDRPEDGWNELVGFPHQLIDTLDLIKEKSKNAVAVLCGPPIMIKAVARNLQEQGMRAEDILTTLEMRMTCGIGKCGKCNIGHRYICVDGPVFDLEQILQLPDEY